jgi:predicted CXXCH cytochrome family protein
MNIRSNIFAALLAIAMIGARQPPATRPTTFIEPRDCVTAECHANIKSFKVIHAPVAADSCEVCHQTDNIAAHTFTTRTSGADLCTYCHEFSTEGMPVVHKPVANGECLGCHDPHGGNTRAIVREESMAALCGRCHEPVTDHKSFAHSPVAQGECDSCHPPHASRFQNLVVAVGSDLCLKCHTDFEHRMNAAPIRHKALEKGCQKCHDPHGSSDAMSLRQPAPDLCFGCHDKLQKQVSGAMFAHNVVTKDRACLTCHTPHFSVVAKLQPKPAAVACMSCHDKEIKTQSATVAAVPEISNPKLFKHGQIKDGECGGCHEVHGGDRRVLLKKGLSRSYYQRFSLENYELCFSCHEERLVEADRTTTVTAFRNGDKNLHVVHANRDDRDRGCNVCHTTHASEGPRLIRATLQYGTWPMPMQFVKTETGGSCANGCHPSARYDREHAVVPATGPATRQSPVIARAQRREDRYVHWTTTDRRGRRVTIPASSSGLTVLLLIGSETTDTAPITNALGDLGSALAVACGTDASKSADRLEANGFAGPIIVDESLHTVRALQARGWPLAILLQSDGLEIARLTGDSQSIALKLASYLRAPSTQGVEDEDSTRRVKRTVRLANALLDSGKAETALATLDTALKSDGSSAELLAARAQALLNLNRPRDAAETIQSIARGALPPAQDALLRSRLAIVQGKWDDARALLEAGLKQSPDDRSLHFQMAKVCEHFQAWQQAAEHYRAGSEAR